MKNVPTRATAEGMPKLNRRTFLSRLGLAGGGMALMAVPAIAAPATEVVPGAVPISQNADAEIFRLAKAFRFAKRAAEKASRLADELEHQIEALQPPLPNRPQMTTEEAEDFLSRTILDIRENDLGIKYQAYTARLDAWNVEVEAIKVKARKAWMGNRELKALRRNQCKACDALWQTGNELLRTRAQSIDGLLVKMRVAKEWGADEDRLEKELSKDLRALKRSGVFFAARARSWPSPDATSSAMSAAPTSRAPSSQARQLPTPACPLSPR